MKKSNFLINTLKLSTAPLVTQLLSFFLMPLITRLYTPSDFGVFNIFSSYVAVLAVFCGLGYHQAIVLPKKDSGGFKLLLISFLLNLVLVIILILLVIFSPFSIYEKLNLIEIYDYRHLIYLSLFFQGIYFMLLGWNIRMENYGLIAFSRISRILTDKSTIIFLAFFSVAASSNLIIGEILGTIITCFIFLIYFKIKKEYFNNNFSNYIQDLKKLVIKHRQFPLYNVSNDLLYRFKTALIIGLLTFYFSTDVVGQYGMALLILAIPTTLVGSSIGEVFYQNIARLDNLEDIALFSLKIFRILCLCSLSIFVFLSFFSEELLPFFLGENWYSTGTFISILCFSIFFEFIFSPLQSVLKKINKQQVLFYFSLTSLLLSTVSILIGGFYEDIVLTFFLFSVFNGLNTLILGLIIFKYLSLSLLKIIKILSTNFAYLIPSIIFLVSIKIFFSHSVILILSMSLGAYLINFLLLKSLVKNFDNEISNIKSLFKR